MDRGWTNKPRGLKNIIRNIYIIILSQEAYYVYHNTQVGAEPAPADLLRCNVFPDILNTHVSIKLRN